MKIIMLMAGGALGTLARYATSGLAHRIYSGAFPMGTLVVNLAGSLIIGLLWGFAETRNLSPNFRSFAFIGLLGGFTTFSTYALETLTLLRENEIRQAVTYVLANNLLGVILAFAGFFIARGLVHSIK
jgi:CrcB protein